VVGFFVAFDWAFQDKDKWVVIVIQVDGLEGRILVLSIKVE
jgi:hypothetical protein